VWWSAISRWGLTYKGVEILTPEEWNAVVDALEELDKRIRCGKAKFSGDGATTTFNIAHEAGKTPIVALVGKATSGLPDIDYWTVDETYISVTFKTAPPSGADVQVWWLAIAI